MLENFETEVVLKRPATHLGGVSYKTVLKRANYALDSEKNLLPKIVIDKDTDEFQRFDFEWSEGSKFRFTGTPEFFYKKEKKLSGQIGGITEIFKQVMKGSKKFLEEEEK